MPIHSPKKRPPICDMCGSTWQVIADTGRIGCARCYDFFADQLAELWLTAKLTGHQHGSDSSGILPQALRRQLDEELARAVAVEDYEHAAELRDRLLSLPEQQEVSVDNCF